MGDFTLHSGAKSTFKIDCDALTDGEISTIASLIAERVEPFSLVHGVPRGGLRIAAALEKYVIPTAKNILLVDDVFTTGRSMEEAYVALEETGRPIQGAVIFSRTRHVPAYIIPLFTMWE